MQWQPFVSILFLTWINFIHLHIWIRRLKHKLKTIGRLSETSCVLIREKIQEIMVTINWISIDYGLTFSSVNFIFIFIMNSTRVIVVSSFQTVVGPFLFKETAQHFEGIRDDGSVSNKLVNYFKRKILSTVDTFGKLCNSKSHPFGVLPSMRYFTKGTLFPACCMSRLASFRIAPQNADTSICFLCLADAGFCYIKQESTCVCEGCGKRHKIKDFVTSPSNAEYHSHGCAFIETPTESVGGDLSQDMESSLSDSEVLPVENQVLSTLPLSDERTTRSCLQRNQRSPDNEGQGHGREEMDYSSVPQRLETLGGLPEGLQERLAFYGYYRDVSEPGYCFICWKCKVKQRIQPLGELNGESVRCICDPQATLTINETIVESSYGMILILKQGESSLDSVSVSESSQSTDNIPKYPSFNDYERRLNSFLGLQMQNIPHEDLARAGFFYAGYADCVRCFQCGLGLRGWEPGDDVYEQHRRHRPTCPHIRQLDNDSRTRGEIRGSIVSITREKWFKRQKFAFGIDTVIKHKKEACTSKDVLRKIPEPTRLAAPRPTENVSRPATVNPPTRNLNSGVSSHPSYPVYISYQNRLESFVAWPEGHIHNPDDLARAGFFYAGYADCVRCYQCGLGLKSWKPEDDINVEHERLRPTCPFLQTQLSSGLSSMMDEPNHQRPQLHSETSSGQSSYGSNDNPPLKPQMLVVPTITENQQSPSQPSTDVQQPMDSQTQAPEGNNVRVTPGAANGGEYGGASYLGNYLTESHGSGNTNETDVRSTIQSDQGIPQKLLLQPSNARHSSSGVDLPSQNKTDSNHDSHKSDSVKDITVSLLEREKKLLQHQVNCKICLVAPIKDLFLPCGHLYSCVDCSKSLTHCPACSQLILATVTTYFT